MKPSTQVIAGAALASLLGLFACGPAEGPRARSVADVRPKAASASTVDVLAIAKEIDPGPVPLLASLMPDALRKELDDGPMGARASQEEKLRLATSRHDDFAKASSLKGDINMDDAVTRAALEAIIALEPIAMDDAKKADAGRAAVELTFYYGLIQGAGSYMSHMPEILRPQLEAQMQRTGLGRLFASAEKDGAKLRVLMTARALRLGDDLVIAEALKIAAGELEKATPFPRLLALHEEALKRRGAAVAAADYVAPAALCLGHMELACARKYIDKARAARDLPDPRYGDMRQRVVDAQLATLQERAGLVEVVTTAEGKKDVDARVAHARGLVALGLYDRAEPELVKLAADALDDARPIALLARLTVAKEGATDASVRRAAALMQGAQARTKNKDRDYYDADVGLRGQVLVWDLAQRLAGVSDKDRPAAFTAEMQRMRGMVTEMAAWEPDRADVVELLIRLVQDIMNGTDKDVRAQFAAHAPEAEALRKKYPSSVEAAAVARAFGVLTPARDTALAAVSFPWPHGPEDDKLQTNLLAQRVVIAAKWNAPEASPTAQDLVAVAEHSQADAAFLRVLSADAAAVTAFQSGDLVQWAGVASQYAGALETAPAQERIRTAVNLAAANAASGREDLAREMMVRAMSSKADYASDENWPFVPLQLAALKVGLVPREESELAFAEILTGPHKNETARERARRWLIWLAVARKDKATAQKLAKEAVDTAGMRDDEHYIGKTKDLTPDVLSGFTFNLHFTPTKPSLYHLDLVVNALIIFVKEPPLTSEALRALAGKPSPKTKPNAPAGKSR